MTLITEMAARAQNLPGSDVFHGPELAYKAPLNRDAFVVSLLHEAYKIVTFSVLIARHQELRAQAAAVQQSLDNGTFNILTHQISPLQWHRMNYVNLENFYIATAFELSLKARLLERDFIVHELERSTTYAAIAGDQKNRPIHKQELFTLTGGYFYDTVRQINILPGLTNITLGFGKLTSKPAYKAEYGISADLIDIAEDYRMLRNQIHLPGGVSTTPTLSRLDDQVVQMLVNFINTEIVDKANLLTAQHTLNRSVLSRL